MYLIGPAVFGVLMLLSEVGLVIAKHSKGQCAKANDCSSLKIIWSSILSCCAFAYILLFMRIPVSTAFELDAVSWALVSVIFGLGLVLRWWSILSLGKFFTVDVAVHQNHKLITTGVYSWVRHPSYTGLLTVFCIFGIVFQNSVCFALVFIPAVITLMYRISVEEKVLEKAFGEEYRLYRKQTSRLIPGLY